MIREATKEEHAKFFPHTPGSKGLVVEKDGAITGYVAYVADEHRFYAHDLAVLDPDARVASYLFQRVRRIARKLGYGVVRFHVDSDYPNLLRLVKKQRARVTGFSLELDT